MQGNPSSIFRLIGTVFLVLVLGSLAASAFFAYRTHAFVSTAESSPGTVVEIKKSTYRDSKGRTSTTYYPIVEYRAEGGKLRVQGSIAGGSYRVGDSVGVLYQRANPEDAWLDTFAEKWVASIVSGCLGAFFSIFFLVFRLVGRSLRGHPELKQTGLPVQGTIEGVEVNRSLRVNRKHPWRIKASCRHPLTGAPVVVYSVNFWQDPTARIQGQKQVTVYFDRVKTKRHYVDFQDSARKVA